MQIVVLSLVFVGVYWLSGMLLGRFVLRLQPSLLVLRVAGYGGAYVGILLLMWWGESGTVWFRWVLWALSSVALGLSATLLAEARREANVARIR